MDPDPSLENAAPATAGDAPAAAPATHRGGRLRLPFRGGDHSADRPDGQMTLVEHLVELRHRVYVSLLSLVPGLVLGFIFSGDIVHFLRSPLPNQEPLEALSLTDPLMIQFQVALIVAIILAMPVILYQLWAYVSPGLTPTERAAARPWVPLAMVFFTLGVGVAYFILPIATGFLYTFQSKDIHILLTADAYFGFVSTLFLAFGLVMEFPILLVLLAKVGLISSARLSRNRRNAIVVIVIASNLITPGADLISPLVMSLVLYLLFEVSIALIRLNGK